MSTHPLPLVVAAGQTVTVATGQTESYPLGVTVDLGGTLDISGSGTDVTTPLLSELLGGTINVSGGGTLDIEGIGAQGLSGAINIGADGTVEEGTNLAAIAPVNFTTNSGTLFLNQNNLANLQLASPITGFQLGDRIEVNSTVTSAS